MTTDEGKNVDRPVNRELLLSAYLLLNDNRLWFALCAQFQLLVPALNTKQGHNGTIFIVFDMTPCSQIPTFTSIPSFNPIFIVSGMAGD